MYIIENKTNSTAPKTITDRAKLKNKVSPNTTPNSSKSSIINILIISMYIIHTNFKTVKPEV